jgi:hypothetical protein
MRAPHRSFDHRLCPECGQELPAEAGGKYEENREPLTEEQLALFQERADKYPFRDWTNTDVLQLLATIRRDRK